MAETDFLCSTCRAAMCHDCREIAGEYQLLLEGLRRSRRSLEYDVEELRRENERLKREVETLKEVLGMGMPALVVAWMSDQKPEELLEKVRTT
jgi:predicted RNase H-like nuclease (RuvC/YqgF family)